MIFVFKKTITEKILDAFNKEFVQGRIIEQIILSEEEYEELMSYPDVNHLLYRNDNELYIKCYDNMKFSSHKVLLTCENV